MKINKPNSGLVDWWRGVGGPREVLQLAWPLMLSTGLFSFTIFVDRMLLYAYSDQAAAGAMGAGTMFWAITCAPVGLLGFTSTFVAQYVGAQRAERALRVVIQGFILALATGPLVAFFALAAPWFFARFHDPSLVAMETGYFRAIALGAWATILAAPLSGLFAGTGRTQALLAIDIVTTLINVLLDYLLIFGLFGFPRWGIVGAGVATTLALLVKLGLMLWAAAFLRWAPDSGLAVSRMPHHGGISLFSSPWRLEFDLIARLVRFGWPAAVSSLAEAASFSVIIMLVGRLGAIPMAASTLALGVNMIAFIPMIGLGQAVGVLVGQRLTKGDPLAARRTARSGLTIAIAYTTCFAIAYGFFPERVLSVYGSDHDPARYEAMLPVVIPLLRFIAVYCILDAIQIVFVGVLKGAGDTAFILLGNVLCGGLSVAIGLLCDDLFEAKLYWWWGVITGWIFLLAIVFASRYWQGGWLEKRVIEKEWKGPPDV